MKKQLKDDKMTSKHLKKFEEKNTTTDSIYDLGDYEVSDFYAR